jgi:peptidoglycan/LPS O-acetylase OafA/YrhL
MTPSATPFHLGYRPALDGLRGIAILFVLLDHGGWLSDNYGFLGVNTFFVLSGFLITALLVAEFDQTGGICFRQFYLRRALRLLPALAAVLVLFVAFSFAFDPFKRAVREVYEALAALFYFTNWSSIYHLGRHISLAHTWSLSLEEQFYIVWPVILLLLLRKSNRPSALCWIALGAFLAIVVRMALFVGATTNLSGNILPISPDRLVCGTDTRADSLLVGCFAGVLLTSNLLPSPARFAKWLRVAAWVSLPGFVAFGLTWLYSPWMICAGWLLASVCVLVIILHVLSSPAALLHRLLENCILVYTGRISYGLYLWHFPILKAMEQHHWPIRNMVYLTVVLPVTLLSYYLIEKPFLRLKKRHQVAQ